MQLSDMHGTLRVKTFWRPEYFWFDHSLNVYFRKFSLRTDLGMLVVFNFDHFDIVGMLCEECK